MGMDLMPLSSEVDPYHFNWSGWRTIGRLLEELKCDLSDMAGSNDGDIVDGDAAYEWGTALKSALDEGRIFAIQFPNEGVYGGIETEFHVEGSPWAGSWSSGYSLSLGMTMKASATKGAPLTEAEHRVVMRAAKSATERLEAEKVTLPRITIVPDDKWGQWIGDAAEFFLKCDGFEQW